jgi:DNA-directed RNA polymerase
MPIRWSTPSGFLVEQAYRKMEKVVVKTSIGKAIRQHVTVVDRPELSPKRNRNGISPNFVHSMDASLLMSVVLTLQNNGVDSVSCIHDSIGVCPADVGILSTAIRECAVDMFSEPILEQVHKEMISYLPAGTDLPEPPARGTMDITQLADADYFFA